MSNYTEIILRSVAVYVFMILAIRLFGKKELSQLNTIDVILILLISNAVQNAMVGPDTSLLGGIAAAAVLFSLNFLLKKLMYRSSWFGKLLDNKPQILIHDGKLDFKQLARLEISNDELKEALREHGIEHFNEVKLAMLEPNGNISIISGEKTLKQTHYKRVKSQNLVKM